MSYYNVRLTFALQDGESYEQDFLFATPAEAMAFVNGAKTAQQQQMDAWIKEATITEVEKNERRNQ